MAWLGEPLPAGEQLDATLPPASPRCTKDLIQEALFDRRRDLFTDLDLLVVMDSSTDFVTRNAELARRLRARVALAQRCSPFAVC